MSINNRNRNGKSLRRIITAQLKLGEDVTPVVVGPTTNGTDISIRLGNGSFTSPLTVKLEVTAYEGTGKLSYAVTTTSAIPPSYSEFGTGKLGDTINIRIDTGSVRYIHMTNNPTVTSAEVKIYNNSDGGALLATLTFVGLG